MARQFLDAQASTTWQSRMQVLAHKCAEAAPDEQAACILEACELLHFVGALVWGASDAWPKAGELEALLAIGAHESAATALLGPDVAFMLSRGGYGICLATVLVPGSENEVTAEGSTLALALLGAMASAMLDYVDQYPMLVSSLNVTDEAPQH